MIAPSSSSPSLTSPSTRSSSTPSTSGSTSSTSSSSSSSSSSPSSVIVYHHDAKFWLDFALVCAVLLLAESARGIVIPILSTYVDQLGGDDFFLAVVVSSFSVGRLIASFLFGIVGDHWSTRNQLLLSCVICVVGNGIFALADFAGADGGGKWVLLFSRTLTGFGTGVLTVARSHVAATTGPNERTKFMSWLGIVQFVGFSFTPSLGGLTVEKNIGLLTIKSTTFGSYSLCVIDAVLVVLIFLFMKNMPHAPAVTVSNVKDGGRHSQIQSDSASANTSVSVIIHKSPLPSRLTSSTKLTVESMNNDNEVAEKQDEEQEDERLLNDEDEDESSRRTISSASASTNTNTVISTDNSLSSASSRDIPVVSSTVSVAPLPDVDYIFPFLYIFLNMCCRGTLGVAETYAATLYFNVSRTHDNTAAGLYITMFGAVGVVLFLSIPRINRYISDSRLLFAGFTFASIGFSLLAGYGDHSDSDPASVKNAYFARYIIGNLCIWSFAAPFCQTLTVAMMSKYLGKRPQGRWMGLVTAGGSIGRIVFPLLAGLLDTFTSLDGAWFFCLFICASNMIVIVCVLGTYANWKQRQDQHRQDMKINPLSQTLDQPLLK